MIILSDITTDTTFTPPIKIEGMPDITGLCRHNGRVLVIHKYGAADERNICDEAKREILKRINRT
jgi:hypothetical protein